MERLQISSSQARFWRLSAHLLVAEREQVLTSPFQVRTINFQRGRLVIGICLEERKEARETQPPAEFRGGQHVATLLNTTLQKVYPAQCFRIELREPNRCRNAGHNTPACVGIAAKAARFVTRRGPVSYVYRAKRSDPTRKPNTVNSVSQLNITNKLYLRCQQPCEQHP